MPYSAYHNARAEIALTPAKGGLSKRDSVTIQCSCGFYEIRRRDILCAFRPGKPQDRQCSCGLSRCHASNSGSTRDKGGRESLNVIVNGDLSLKMAKELARDGF